MPKLNQEEIWHKKRRRHSQNRRVSKTTSLGQSTETQVIHQKQELLLARQDLQGQSHKALKRAGTESHQYPEFSLTRRG